MNWSTHSAKIANKISRTLGIMNRLKRYLPFSAMKLMYDSLILSHLQFGITCWGFEWNRIFKLQKRALRIMTNSKYNAHTEPLFKELEMLKVCDIFDVHVWNSGTNLWTNLCLNILARYLHSITNYTKLKHAVRTNSICFLPELSVLVMFWGTVSQNCCRAITQRAKTHSIESFVTLLKAYIFGSYSYECTDINCYSCKHNVRWFFTVLVAYTSIWWIVFYP